MPKCPECTKEVKGKSCSCGWSGVASIHDLSPEELKNKRTDVLGCWWKTNERNCKLTGTTSSGVGGGKEIRGPWYCLWHYELLTRGEQPKGIELWDAFQDFLIQLRKQGNSHQFGTGRAQDVWRKVNGLEE